METIKNVNKVQSRLMVWSNPFSSGGQDVIICIVGNPGIIDVYEEFSSELHKSTGLPVCLVGQAGHDLIPGEKPCNLKGQEHLFDLKGQVEHKVCLINDHIDKQSKLHLIGHSIGAWLIIESLQNNPSIKQRVSSINLLFPTLQKMSETKNGRHINNRVRKFHSSVMFFITLLNILPQCILKGIAYLYLKMNGLPLEYSDRTLKYIKPDIVKKVLHLAYDELDSVNTLNTEAINDVKHLTNIIYGESDGWVPLHYIEDFKQFQPPLEMTKVLYPHEFILQFSEQVAEMVADYIKRKM